MAVSPSRVLRTGKGQVAGGYVFCTVDLLHSTCVERRLKAQRKPRPAAAKRQRTEWKGEMNDGEKEQTKGLCSPEV